jgi:hypothetical protein
MIAIVFDETQRSFSAVQIEDQREYGAVGDFMKNNPNATRGIITGSSAVLGSGVRAVLARRKAKKKLAEQGIDPSDPDYKRKLRKATAKGIAIGAGAGALAGEAGQLAHKTAKLYKGVQDQYKLNQHLAGKEGYVLLDKTRKDKWNDLKTAAKSARIGMYHH